MSFAGRKLNEKIQKPAMGSYKTKRKAAPLLVESLISGGVIWPGRKRKRRKYVKEKEMLGSSHEVTETGQPK